jgi:antitoxin (DNA-binding transcriptional repressor) of toxin-antitoxin stability system
MILMKKMTATEAARGFSRVLDMLENGTEEIVIIRNDRPVAKLVPGTPQMTALEALSDLYRTLPDEEGRRWLKDLQKRDRSWKREVRNRWE